MIKDLMPIYIMGSSSGRMREVIPIINEKGESVGTIDSPVLPATLLLDDIEGWSVKMLFGNNSFWYKVEDYLPSHHTE